jgi:hypothetical protein
MRAVRALLLAVVVVASAAGTALAQPGRNRGPDRPQSNMSKDERRQLRQDVDSARGNYQRRDMRRQDRMAPEDREKLRRDVQDASRDLRKR